MQLASARWGVRICANKVVAGVRCGTLLINIRPVNTCQFVSARDFDQLEGLAVEMLRLAVDARFSV
jgi:hypothetical protein